MRARSKCGAGEPKFEFRSFTGRFDERLKIQAELLQHLHRVRGTFRGFIEPAIDQQFRGFERVTIHIGMLWPATGIMKLEVFNSAGIAKCRSLGSKLLECSCLCNLAAKTKGKRSQSITPGEAEERNERSNRNLE